MSVMHWRSSSGSTRRMRHDADVGSGRERDPLRPGARCGRGSGAVVADRLAGGRTDARRMAAASARDRDGRRGRRRPGPRVRTVRGRRPGHSGAGCTDGTVGRRRSLPIRTKPDVRGGGRRDPRAGAVPRPGRAAVVRDRHGRGRRDVRARLRGTRVASPVRRPVRRVPAARAGLVPRARPWQPADPD